MPEEGGKAFDKGCCTIEGLTGYAAVRVYGIGSVHITANPPLYLLNLFGYLYPEGGNGDRLLKKNLSGCELIKEVLTLIVKLA